MTDEKQGRPPRDGERRDAPRQQESKLDRALEETYPASDPVSIVQPPPSASDKKKP